MLPNWNDMRVAEQHRQEMLASSARERMVRSAAAGGPRAARLGRHLGAQLGRVLVAWGTRLQAMEPEDHPAPLIHPGL